MMSVHLGNIGKTGEAARLWQSAFNPRTGFFSTVTINHYLRYAITVENTTGDAIGGKHIATVYSGTTIAHNDKISTVLGRLPPHTRNWGFIVHLERPAHAIAVIKHHETWYLVDLMASGPQRLSECWPQDKGAVYYLALLDDSLPAQTHVALHGVEPPQEWRRPQTTPHGDDRQRTPARDNRPGPSNAEVTCKS